MTESADSMLLEDFARNDSETAFATLVQRHIALVYSVALRHTANSEHAQDITQAVFIILARKASTLGRRTVLPGWLYHTARLTAANFQRAEERRIRREHEVFMQSNLEAAAPEVAWRDLSPQLDEAMARLSAADRDAVVLRYFQNKSLAEVGAALGLEERAAQKRVSRALEKLRRFFMKRGVVSTTPIIAGGLSANSVQAAPVALAKLVTSVAVAKGATATASTLTLVKGTLKLMAWIKWKFAVGASAAILLTGGVITIGLSATDGTDNLPPKAIIKKSLDKYALLTSYSDKGKTVSVRNGNTNIVTTFEMRLLRPNLYRIEWELTVFPAVPTKGAVWSTGDGDFSLYGESKFGPPRRYEKKKDMEAALAEAALSGRGAANAFFNLGGSLKVLAFGAMINVVRQKDETIGGVDCYVIAGKGNNSTRTVWIGKRDSLLHQSQTINKPPTPMSPNTAALDAEFERQAKDLLAQLQQEATPEAIASMVEKLRQSMDKSNTSTTILTETHEDIVVNHPFSKADFVHPVPDDLKLGKVP